MLATIEAAPAVTVFAQPERQPRIPEFDYLGPEVASYSEACKSFDPLASVRMYRYDLYHFGHILPETHQRIMDEEISLMAEGVNRVARTKFVLRRSEGNLQYKKGGEWASYREMLETGKRAAELSAAEDSRKQFLVYEADDDLDVHYDNMLRLRPGEQYTWASTYCQDIEDTYGPEFVRSCGRFPGRKMGFLYLAECSEDGNVVLISQTIDGDNREAVAAALDRARRGNVTMDNLVSAHDNVVGGDVYAGRPGADVRENAWQTIQQHTDLIQYFLDGLERIARQRQPITVLEDAIKRHMYGTWAALKNRIDGLAVPAQYLPRADGVPIAHLAMVGQEVQRSFQQFVEAGIAMGGCGGEIKMLQGEQDILAASTQSVFEALFGVLEDRFGSLIFECTEGHSNKREVGRLRTTCRVPGCKGSVGCGPKKLAPAA